jgi:hypothetical protein
MKLRAKLKEQAEKKLNDVIAEVQRDMSKYKATASAEDLVAIAFNKRSASVRARVVNAITNELEAELLEKFNEQQDK